MAEDTENSAKKHRVIHWNPDAGREQARKRWTWKRIVAWSLGGFFALLVVAGIINRLPKLFGAPSLSDMLAARSVEAVAPENLDPNSVFTSRAKAEQAHELSAKALAELKKLPTDHPRQLEQLILLEKSFIEGETYLAHHDFSQAFAIFEVLDRDIDAFSKNVKAKGEAKQGYDAILLRIRDLESARTLAPEALDSAYAAAGEGRKLVEDGNFTGAMRIFDRGFTELKKAEQVLAEHVRTNLVSGEKALAQGQKDEAKRAFTAALEKSPGNEAALRGLKRAENIDRVHALLIQGDRQEKEKQFAAAADSYGKAFSLDPLSAEAQQGQARAARLEKETKFAAARTAAEEAVKRREWNLAIQEFQNALKVYPQKTEVQTALKSAKENAHKDAVQKALAKGYAYENNHQWTEAREAYNETLELDPENADAKERYKETGRIMRALLQYNSLIDSAEQLANKAEFQSALKSFNQAVNSKPDYLEYSDRVLQLRKLLQEQSKPVEVTFRSDGKTYVSIVNYKQPQQFESMTLKILPGDYEVVGRRKGYRDLRMMLQVRNGTPPPTVTVVCNVSADRF